MTKDQITPEQEKLRNRMSTLGEKVIILDKAINCTDHEEHDPDELEDEYQEEFSSIIKDFGRRKTLIIIEVDEENNDQKTINEFAGNIREHIFEEVHKCEIFPTIRTKTTTVTMPDLYDLDE